MVQSGFPSEAVRDEHGRGLPHAFDRLTRGLPGPEEGDQMAKSVLYMSMSLDGFISGPDDGPGNGLAAGEQNVMVHGADLAQSLLREGLLDEMEIHLIPVLLGEGRRLFDADRVELELTRVLDAPGVTHLRYRVAS
jgi:hypothetical protein